MASEVSHGTAQQRSTTDQLDFFLKSRDPLLFAYCDLFLLY